MKRLSAFYTLICTLCPILRVYSFFGNTFTVLDTLIAIFYVIAIPSLFVKGIKVVWPYMIMLLFVLMHSVVLYMGNSDMGLFMRALHQMNYVFFLAVFYNVFFDKDIALKSIRIAAVCATLFLILQHIGHMFGVTISGQIAQFAVREANLENYVAGSNVSRFSSFFAEPSAYGVFVVCPLTLELFYRKKVDMFVVALLCVGCVLSTSNTAVACMAFLLFFYIIKNKIFNFKIVLLIAVGVVLFFLVTPYIDAIRTRVEGGTSFENRFIGYEIMKYYLDDPIFGGGFISMLDVGEYMPGFVRIIVYLGIVGAIVYAGIYLKIFMTTSRKMVLLIFLFLNVGSNILFAATIIYYSCFFLDNKKIKERQYEKGIHSNYNLQQL